jgi:hypothetical protein
MLALKPDRLLVCFGRVANPKVFRIQFTYFKIEGCYFIELRKKIVCVFILIAG